MLQEEHHWAATTTSLSHVWVHEEGPGTLLSEEPCPAPSWRTQRPKEGQELAYLQSQQDSPAHAPSTLPCPQAVMAGRVRVTELLLPERHSLASVKHQALSHPSTLSTGPRMALSTTLPVSQPFPVCDTSLCLSASQWEGCAAAEDWVIQSC